ncbi:MAG: histidine kinase, partial [Curvibacter sp.]
MAFSPVPANELTRLKGLRELMLLDTPAEPLFDTLAQKAAEVCQAPIALVSLIDVDRQWFKANVGLTGVQE